MSSITRSAQIEVYGLTNNKRHGQDWFAINNDYRPRVMIAVGDGVSASHSSGAARTVVETALTFYKQNPTQSWSEYCERLLGRLNCGDMLAPAVAGHTTLTLLWVEPTSTTAAVAKYLAIGDSPIYIAYRGPIMESFPDTFLVSAVHRKPLVVQNPARLYAYVDCAYGHIVGRVAGGSFELRAGDICLVCTDGVPVDGKMILGDLVIGKSSHRFLNDVQLRGPRQASERLFRAMAKKRGFDDDATLVTVLISEMVHVHDEAALGCTTFATEGNASINVLSAAAPTLLGPCEGNTANESNLGNALSASGGESLEGSSIPESVEPGILGEVNQPASATGTEDSTDRLSPIPTAGYAADFSACKPESVVVATPSREASTELQQRSQAADSLSESRETITTGADESLTETLALEDDSGAPPAIHSKQKTGSDES